MERQESEMVFRLNTRDIWLVALLFFIGPSSLVAQSQSQIVADAKVNGQASKIANAISVETPPIIDDDVLSDPVWVQAVPVSGFLQSAPNEGQPATERTEVRIVFTRDTIFFGGFNN